jgi:hypothetical protein
VHHSAELVHTIKRAITLFVNIKKVEIPVELLPQVRNSDMQAEMEAFALQLGQKAI